MKNDDRWRKLLGKFTDAHIKIEDDVIIECDDPFMLLRLVYVMKAFGRGFDFEDSMDLLDEDYALEMIDIRNYAGKSENRQVALRGRIIGRGGMIKMMIEDECEAKIAVYGKTVSIISKLTGMARTMKAVDIVLSGSKYTSMLKFLKDGHTGARDYKPQDSEK